MKGAPARPSDRSIRKTKREGKDFLIITCYIIKQMVKLTKNPRVWETPPPKNRKRKRIKKNEENN